MRRQQLTASHEVPRSKADLDLARSFFVMSETLTIGFVNEPFLFRNQRAIKYVRHSVRMRHSCVCDSYIYSKATTRGERLG